MMILRKLKKKRAGVGWGDIEHNTRQGRANFFASFLYDTKVTNTTNEMAIRTQC